MDHYRAWRYDWPMNFPRARVTAPLLHVYVFALTWVLNWLQRQPLLDGPSRWPFLLVFFGDFPVSAVAFGVMFGSDQGAPYAIAAWGTLGTPWWYFLGRWWEERRQKV